MVVDVDVVFDGAVDFDATVVLDVVTVVGRGRRMRNFRRRLPIRSACSASVIRNIAEGAGRWSKLDMAKHYKIARGEAMESAASLDVLEVRGALEAPRYTRGIELLEAVVSMLTRMIDR